MNLESKLGISTGLLIVALLANSLNVNLRLGSVMKQASVTYGQRLPFLVTIERLGGSLATAVSEIEAASNAGTQSPRYPTLRETALQALQAARADLSLLHAQDHSLVLTSDVQGLQALDAQLSSIETLQRQIDDTTRQETPESAQQAHALLEQHLLPLHDAARRQIAGIARSQTVLKDREISVLRRGDAMILLTLWITTGFSVIVGGIVAFVIARRITQGIRLVAARADSIASGDLTGGRLNLDSSDQIGALARSMEKMQASLADIIGVGAQAVGSLTPNVASMRFASDQIHRRVDQQTQLTQQAATAMQEMSASIAEVSRHAQSASETARSAAQTAHEGGAIVKRMLGSIRSIATAVSETSATVGVLGEDSHRISQIVTVIDEIARKTNLLALNAAIEAARAGEQGRGFAVVAGEVRHLASSTAQATGEISAMIQGIQDRTRSAIASMDAGNITVEQGVVTTNQAGEALERIIGMAERVERMITQIAIAASQQAAAADQSSSSLDSIHTLSHQNLAEMATTAAGIETLRVTAANLERQVERFRLATPTAAFASAPALPLSAPHPYPA